MATRRSNSRPSRSGGSSRPGSSVGPFLFGVLFTLAALLAGWWAYLHYGHPTAAIKSSAAALQSSVTPTPARAHMPHEVKQPPFGISEDVFESGAKVYSAHCAACHGIPGQDASAKTSSPPAPQLWRPLPHSLGIGVSNLPPGETYSRIEDGVHPPAMPAYRHILTSTQIWQVSLLLKSADQPLPEPVQRLLRGTP